MARRKTSVLIRDLDKSVVEKLKRRARQNDRSLQAELRSILEIAAKRDWASAREAAARMRKLLEGRKFSDSTKDIREDRDSR